MVDALKAKAGRRWPATVARREHFTYFPNDIARLQRVGQRVDGVVCTRGLLGRRGPTTPQLRAAEILQTEGGSDHVPLIAEVRLPGRPPPVVDTDPVAAMASLAIDTASSAATSRREERTEGGGDDFPSLHGAVDFETRDEAREFFLRNTVVDIHQH